MKFLITGNMGYIGGCVTRAIRRALPNATLVGFDAGYFSHCLSDSPALPETRIDVQHFGDVRAFPGALLRDVDAVVHLAAVSNDPMGNAFEGVTHDINYESSKRIATMAAEAGVHHFVFASSCSIYGFSEDGPRKEP